MQILGVPWLQLPGQQNILVQVLFTEADYAVRVTDLQTIWGEDLNRRGIRSRANEIDCPIDAESNLVDLLQRLQDALTVDSDATSILLKRRHDRLTLTTTETIGDTAIEWPFQLVALPFSAVATGLTLSLFSMMAFYQRELKSLLAVIDEKDTLISQMNDFMRSANLAFKPNRRRKAFEKFDKAEWLDECRAAASKNHNTSQDVIDGLSIIGRDAEFRKDWRAVLSEIGKWDVQFLPETTERTPGRVTSSIKPRAKGHPPADIFKNLPGLTRDDTESQNNVFLTPQAKRIKDKTKIHTKWSSPFTSSAPSSDAVEEDDGFQDDVHVTPQRLGQSRSPSPSMSPSPTLRQPNRYKALESKDRVLPIYNRKDEGESQEIEEDLSPVEGDRETSNVLRSEVALEQEQNSDDTTDESDEDLDNIVKQSIPDKAIEKPQKHASSSQRSNSEDFDQVKASQASSKHTGATSPAAGEQQAQPRGSRILNHIVTPRKQGILRNKEDDSHRDPEGDPVEAEKSPLHGKARILNHIKPHKKSEEEKQNAGAAVGSKTDALLTRDDEPPDADSQVIDLEADRRKKALEKRKQAEAIQKSPVKKRVRKF